MKTFDELVGTPQTNSEDDAKINNMLDKFAEDLRTGKSFCFFKEEFHNWIRIVQELQNHCYGVSWGDAKSTGIIRVHSVFG